MEVGVLEVNSKRAAAVGSVSFKCLFYKSRTYRSRGLVVEQREGLAVECVPFRCWSYWSRSYRSRGHGVEQHVNLIHSTAIPSCCSTP
jgi:hypothetical protein